MDQVINQQPETEGPSKQNSLGIILFLVLVIILIITALLYFNIIPLNKFLQQNNKPVTSTSAPTKPSNEFQYDTAKAKTLLTQYIKDTLKPEFLPANIELKQGLGINNKIVEKETSKFGALFVIENSNISTTFLYKESSNMPNGYGIIIQLNNNDQATATASLANLLLPMYFTNPYVVNACKTNTGISYCENFQTLTDGKRGYGITIGKENNKLLLTIFTCFFPKESTYYNSLRSCIAQ